MKSPRLVFVFALLVASALRAIAADRPNILWLVSEDNIPILGSFGEPLARTPQPIRGADDMPEPVRELPPKARR